jgi:fluoride ion exporter CrcB/FEX
VLKNGLQQVATKHYLLYILIINVIGLFFLGCWAHFFSTAVRTEKGISMLLIERSEGVETKLIKTSYSTCAGTAYVSFENVRSSLILQWYRKVLIFSFRLKYQ